MGRAHYLPLEMLRLRALLPDSRFIKFYLTSLTFTIGAIFLILLLVAIVVALPVVLNFVRLPEGMNLIVRIARWPILFVIVALVLSVLYRYGPSRTQADWRGTTWGSACASVAWLAASVLFSWYIANFGTYDKIYGSLGGIIGFMTWIWISVLVVLVGAKLDAEISPSQRSPNGSARYAQKNVTPSRAGASRCWPGVH